MEKKVIVRVQSQTQELQFGYWDNEEEEFVPVKNQEDVEKAATLLGCSTKLIDALMMLTDNVSQSIHSDLVDIWQRLDAIEEKITKP